MGRYDALVNPPTIGGGRYGALTGGDNGQAMQSAVSAATPSVGPFVTWNSQNIPVSENILDSLSASEYVLGTNLNPANADIRSWAAPALSFSGGVYPSEESIITKMEGGRSVSYTVLKRAIPAIASKDVVVMLIVYRTPETVEQMDLSTTGIAGAPKPMQPPVNPHA